MWPFNKNNEKEKCDHKEWETLEDGISYPDKVYFEDGQPYVHKLTNTRKKCKNCGHVVWNETAEEKVYLAVKDREALNND